jgi:hypothetical protein
VKPVVAVVVCALALSGGAVARAWAAGDPAPPAPATKPLKITFYPILARVPIFGATIHAPATGGGGGESGDQSGTTDVALNAAYMTGISIESNRWFAEGQALWAALSAHHSLPLVSVDSDLYFFNGRGGLRVFRGVFATGGFRRVSLGLDVELTEAKTKAVITGSSKPAFWDPLIGVDWRGSIGRGWTFDADVQGGGFGVGTDVDLSGDVYADWQFARHFSLRLGYTVVYFKMTIDDVRLGSLDRSVIATQSLHGPAFGFGIVF